MELAALIGFAAVAIVATCCDLVSRRLPNAITLAALGVGLALRLADGGIGSVGRGALGALVGLALLVPLFVRGWLGGGDVKFVAAAGAWLGPIGILWSTGFGVAAGGVLALATLALGGRDLRRSVASNLSLLVLTGAPPTVGDRRPTQQVPLVVALAGAALAVFVWQGGLRG